MIKAVFDRDAMTLTLSGHAGYGPKGQDIVCAGVSTLVYTLINSCKCEISGETVRVKDNRAVFEAVLCGLRMISEKFPKNLHFIPTEQMFGCDIMQSS